VGEFRGFLTSEGLLGRSVRDIEAAFWLVSGPAPGDPYRVVRGSPLRQRRVRRLRVGLSAVPPGSEQRVDDSCAAAVEIGGELCSRRGHRVRVVELPCWHEAVYEAHIGVVLAASIKHELDQWAKMLGVRIDNQHVEEWTWQYVERGRRIAAGEYLASVEHLQTICRTVGMWWQDEIDILLTPTIPVPAPRLGFVERSEADVGVFLRLFNVTGQPALSLPVSQSSEGLPVGLQLVAAPGREDLLFALAAEIEHDLPGLGWPRLVARGSNVAHVGKP
jgi:amidase